MLTLNPASFSLTLHTGKLESMMDDMSDLMMDANEVQPAPPRFKTKPFPSRFHSTHPLRFKSAWAGRMTSVMK